jgi:serine/threonine-protein kinase
VTDAVQELEQAGYPAEVQRQISQSQVGRVLSQEPDPDTELDSGEPVVIVVGRSSASVGVPRVVGLRVGEVFRRLLAARLRGRKVDVESNKAKGVVVKQQPAAGVDARRGSFVVLSVSKGARLVTVPLVEGLRQAAAVSRLKRSGSRPSRTCRHKSLRARSSARARRRVRVSPPTPRCGSTWPARPRARATRRPRPARRRSRTWSGLPDTEGVACIKKAGFRVQSTAVSSGEPTGTVLTQSPADGTVAQRGEAHRLGGAKVRVAPNVVGRTEADAQRVLRAAGFLARSIDRTASEQGQIGRVVEQDPAAGTRVQGSTEVLIFIGRAAQ